MLVLVAVLVAEAELLVSLDESWFEEESLEHHRPHEAAEQLLVQPDALAFALNQRGAADVWGKFVGVVWCL